MLYQKQIETRYTVDILVVGGGASGVAAAVSAARMGKKVLLCESNGCFGGAGTSGMVPAFGPFTDGVNVTCSGVGLEIRRNAAKNTPEALPTILETLQGKGYEFVPISQLIYKDNYEIKVDGTQSKISE